MPEIHAGTVEIKAIAREAGSRSKVAVAQPPGRSRPGRRHGRPARRPGPGGRRRAGRREDRRHPVDRGLRRRSWPTRCSPAQVVGVDIDEEHRIASVTVPERMLSLAIGREGQNARLAAQLTGWRIDIRSDQRGAPRDATGPDVAADAGPSRTRRSRRRRAGGPSPSRAAREPARRSRCATGAAAVEAAPAGRPAGRRRHPPRPLAASLTASRGRRHGRAPEVATVPCASAPPTCVTSVVPTSHRTAGPGRTGSLPRSDHRTAAAAQARATRRRIGRLAKRPPSPTLELRRRAGLAAAIRQHTATSCRSDGGTHGQ